jgi:adenine-specific DNA-methyltransferase
MTIQKIESQSREARSADITAENIAQLKALFPELLTESVNGVAINVDVLKQLVGDAAVTDAEEKYGLNWHGKRRARQIALTPSTGTLRPCPDESVDWDTTQNLMIEGDNLEVLKLLQKSYAGKVKMIYIDPPYNTGKDFVYPDNFQDNIKNYLEITGQVEGGKKISSNTEASGRFHTDWLNMMYPRLKLARNLLQEDGLFFVSIDDSESENISRVLSEIFGEENFVGCLVWQKKVSPSNDSQFFSNDHEYIIVYAKNKQPGVVNRLDRTEDHNKYYTNPDDDPHGVWNSTAATCNKNYLERPNLYYPIPHPRSGEEVWPRKEAVWALSKDRMLELLENNGLYWGADGNLKSPRIKNYLSEAKKVVPRSVLLYKDVGHTQSATNEYRALLPDVEFDYPKPSSLIQYLIGLASNDVDTDFTVLDFFAGSGTTGQAVMQSNAKDGENRKYILVQLPEPLDDKSQAYGAGYRAISEITKERLRRSGAKVKVDNPMFAGDTGFRVFKLDTSNIRSWNPDRDNLEKTLFDHEEHLLPGRSEADIVYELLLKLGLDLCVPIESRNIAGKMVGAIGGGVLIACLTEHITTKEVEAVAQGIVAWRKEFAPAGDTTCVFRDSAFENDIAKSNLAAILEQYGIANVRSL